MPDITAQCTACGHAWTPRKPPEAIDRPRCSDCGASGEAIDFDSSDEPDERESEAVQAAKRERRATEVWDRIDQLHHRVEMTAPEEADARGADEVQGEYVELGSLLDHLETNDPSLEELEAIDERVDDLEEAVDDYAEELDRVNTLADTVDELEHEKDALEADIQTLEQRFEDHRDILNRLDDKQDALQYGKMECRYEAKQEFAIHVPCARCGQEMTVEPDSEMHQAVVDYLHRMGWQHRSCPTPPAASN